MDSSKTVIKTTQVDASEAGLGIGSRIYSRIAPAVALLLLGDAVYAGVPGDSTVFPPDGGPPVGVPEPSVLSLLAVGAVVVGAAKYIQHKRRK